MVDEDSVAGGDDDTELSSRGDDVLVNCFDDRRNFVVDGKLTGKMFARTYKRRRRFGSSSSKNMSSLQSERLSNSSIAPVDDKCYSLGCPSSAQMESRIDGSVMTAEGHVAGTSSGSCDEFIRLFIMKQCQHGFSKLILCQKFASLCKLLTENFHGINLDEVLDLSLINSRMNGGVYDQTPSLFTNDIQQVSMKLNLFGSQMVSLAMSLSDLSRLLFDEAAGGSDQGGFSHKQEEFAAESIWHREQVAADPSVYSAGNCRRCRKKSDASNCVVCDSCEEVFHLSCIEPVIKEIPQKYWYCSACTKLDVKLIHKNRVPCFFWD